MIQRPEGGDGGLANLPEPDLEAFCKEAKRELVETELTQRRLRLMIDKSEKEVEWRKSAKPKRPREEWQRLWFEDVLEVAKAHNMDLNMVCEIARNIEAKLDNDFNLQVRQEPGTS